MNGPALTPLPDGIEAFQNAIQQHYGFVSFRALAGRKVTEFRTAFASGRMGGIGLNGLSVSAPHYGLSRNRARGEPAYMLVLFEAGGEIAFRGQREGRAGPGQLMLIGGCGDYETEQLGELLSLSAVIPSRVLKSFYPAADDWCFRPLDASQGGAGVLKDVLKTLWCRHHEIEATAAVDLTNALVQLVGSAFKSRAGLPDFQSRSTELLFLRVRDFIAQHLEDPDLGPEMIADRLGISKSYLSKIVNAAATTVCRLILEQRLQRTRELLANPAMRGRSVSEIAYALGFQDLAHLSRRFSERFGQSPSAFRADIGAAT